MYEIEDKKRIGLPIIAKIKDYIINVMPDRKVEVYQPESKDSVILFTYHFIIRINYPIRDSNSVFITYYSLDEPNDNDLFIVTTFMPFMIDSLKRNVFEQGVVEEIEGE